MVDAALAALEQGNVDAARGVLATALVRQRETIRDLRNLSFGLEPVVLRDHGFAAALGELSSQLGTTHRFRIDVDVDAADELGQSAQVALYTIVRELLEQAIRRGPPSRMEISMRRTDEDGSVTVITDDAEPERRRRSFEAIEERVKQLHGRIEMSTDPGAGTRVVVTLPPYASQR